SKITDELNRRLVPLYPDVRIRVRKGTNNNLELYSKDKDEKKAVQKLIEQAFNEADEWLLM
ncbi:TPA: DinI-like family protein, partial [Vibrio parahaemolyticus]